jgi:hypothetical protein
MLNLWQPFLLGARQHHNWVSHCFWKFDRKSGGDFVKWFAQNLDGLLYTYLHALYCELMKSVGIHGQLLAAICDESGSLTPSEWFSHKVMTALIVMLYPKYNRVLLWSAIWCKERVARMCLPVHSCRMSLTINNREAVPNQELTIYMDLLA